MPHHRYATTSSPGPVTPATYAKALEYHPTHTYCKAIKEKIIDPSNDSPPPGQRSLEDEEDFLLSLKLPWFGGAENAKLLEKAAAAAAAAAEEAEAKAEKKRTLRRRQRLSRRRQMHEMAEGAAVAAAEAEVEAKAETAEGAAAAAVAVEAEVKAETAEDAAAAALDTPSTDSALPFSTAYSARAYRQQSS